MSGAAKKSSGFLPEALSTGFFIVWSSSTSRLGRRNSSPPKFLSSVGFGAGYPPSARIAGLSRKSQDRFAIALDNFAVTRICLQGRAIFALSIICMPRIIRIL